MMSKEERKDERSEDRKSGLSPDPETLHTTDPQEKMEGPVSSSMHEIGKTFDSDESKEEADEKKDQRL